MRYLASGNEIALGDRVIVEGDVPGLVVCDFEKQVCLDGYEDWLTDKDVGGGQQLNCGVMIKTDRLGFLHYPDEDEAIVQHKQ